MNKRQVLHSKKQDELLDRSIKGEENIYQHKCVICDKLFLGKGKMHFICEHCEVQDES